MHRILRGPSGFGSGEISLNYIIPQIAKGCRGGFQRDAGIENWGSMCYNLFARGLYSSVAHDPGCTALFEEPPCLFWEKEFCVSPIP